MSRQNNKCRDMWLQLKPTCNMLFHVFDIITPFSNTLLRAPRTSGAIGEMGWGREGAAALPATAHDH